MRIGDRAIVAAGGSRPITWLGHRAIACRHHPRARDIWPIRVAAGAFGEGVPARDLWLSPGHNVAIEGVLMPIELLVNGHSVVQVQRPRVEYWHVELDAHDVIFAEGLAAESYLDTGNRHAFANAGAFIAAHPDFRPRHWAETCLPLVFGGVEVARARALLHARLASMRFGTTHRGQDRSAPEQDAGVVWRWACTDAHAKGLQRRAGGALCS